VTAYTPYAPRNAFRACRVGDVPGLCFLLFGGEVLPEVRDRVHAVRAAKRRAQTLQVVQIGLHDFGTSLGEGVGAVLVRIARYRPAGELARGVAKDC